MRARLAVLYHPSIYALGASRLRYCLHGRAPQEIERLRHSVLSRKGIRNFLLGMFPGFESDDHLKPCPRGWRRRMLR